MTELLYLEDCYAKEFDATVTKADGKFIVLDKTLFYPTGGGQPSDTGKLTSEAGETYNVLYAKKTGDDVSIELDREGLKEGDQVQGTVDWDRRYKHMRYHTACHLLSAVVHEETGALITGNQIAEDKSRIDFNLENFDKEKIKGYTSKVNEIIEKSASVNIKNLPKEEAFKLPAVLRLKNVLPPSIDEIRIIDIEGHDAQACGGTHLKNTEEIGKVEITKIDNKGKNNRRLYFVIH